MANPDAELDDAVTRAARLLGASRAPVIVIIAADIAATVAAFRLAERLGAAIDHLGAEAALRDQAVLQDVGLMLISPAEARRRADVVLLVGDQPLNVWPGRRKMLALTSQAPSSSDFDVTWLRADAATLPAVLAALRARINGRPIAPGFADAVEIDAAASLLKAAAYGVALWSADELATLTIEMLAGLVKDLNLATRWSGLPAATDVSRTAAAMASGWMTGLPLRVSYAGGRPTHDPWRYDARRLVESGEADAIVCVSALGDPLPEWIGVVPSVVLSTAPTRAKGASVIDVPIGSAGSDHDAILFNRLTGTLTQHPAATVPSEIPSAAMVLRRICDALPPP